MKERCAWISLTLAGLCLAGCPAPPDNSPVGMGKMDAGGGAEPLDVSGLESPWKHAKVGSWAVYYRAENQEPLIRYTINEMRGADAMEGSPAQIVIGESNPAEGPDQGGGRVHTVGELEAEFKPPEGAPPPPPMEAKEVEIGGKTTTVKVHSYGGEQFSGETWVSDTLIPFEKGLVKSVQNKNVQLELLAWGTADDVDGTDWSKWTPPARVETAIEREVREAEEATKKAAAAADKVQWSDAEETVIKRLTVLRARQMETIDDGEAFGKTLAEFGIKEEANGYRFEMVAHSIYWVAIASPIKQDGTMHHFAVDNAYPEVVFRSPNKKPYDLDSIPVEENRVSNGPLPKSQWDDGF